MSTGGQFKLVENVTEEVQSLRSRVELLERVGTDCQSLSVTQVNISPDLFPHIFSFSLCAEVTDGPDPGHQLPPAVIGRGHVRENHLTLPLIPATRPHRIAQWADWLPWGTSWHMWVTLGWPLQPSQPGPTYTFYKSGGDQIFSGTILNGVSWENRSPTSSNRGESI